MVDIYAKAEGVFAWMGEEDDSAQITMPLMDGLASTHYRSEHTASRSIDSGLYPIPFNDIQFYRDLNIDPITPFQW